MDCDGERQGIGRELHPETAELYEGELSEGLPNGFGRMIYGTISDFDYYEGYWLNGQRDDSGSLFLKDGTAMEGVWERDELI